MTEPTIRMFHIANCPSVSGKSTLGYHFGADEAENIALKISSNSGGGFFSDEWVPLELVARTLRAAKGSISSGTLRQIFRGKSVNTAGFLLAVLKHEGAVQLVKGKARRYQLGDLDGFLARVHTAAVSKKTATSKGKAATTHRKAIQRPLQVRR